MVYSNCADDSPVMELCGAYNMTYKDIPMKKFKQPMTRTLRHLAAAVILLILPQGLRGIEVDVDEVRTSKKVIFQNYTGPYRVQDSDREIRDIGTGLASGVAGAGDNRPFRLAMKYSVIHAVSSEEPQKLSADIISIDRDARIGHINAINLVLAGYLQKMYAYSEKNSMTLALFVTYYNAVYRGNLEYFGKKYKRVVTAQVNRGNAGLSTRYYQWPGATKIIIPLTEEAKRGKLDSIDPFVLSDRNVRDLVRKDDKNLEERKNLITMKEEVVKKEKDDTRKERADLEREKKSVTEEKKRVEEKKKKIEEEKKELDKEKKSVKDITDETRRKEKEREIKKKEDALKETEKSVKKEEEKTVKKDQEIKKKETETSRRETETEKKEKTVKEEKKELEKDVIKKEIEKDPATAKSKLKEKSEELEKKEKDLEKKEEALKEKKPERDMVGEKLYYMKTNEWAKNGNYDNEFYIINAALMKIMVKSPVSNIGGRRFDIFPDGVVIITHTGGTDARHRLTLVDRDTLSAKYFGTDAVFPRSFVEIRENFIYAVVEEKNRYYLARFDDKLKLAARSKEEVHKDTFITFYNEFIYINNGEKKIMVLKKEDLSLVDLIKP